MSRNIIDQHMTKKILILSGDGVGPEIIAQAEKILSFLNTKSQLDVQLDHGLFSFLRYSITNPVISTLGLAYNTPSLNTKSYLLSSATCWIDSIICFRPRINWR